MSKVTEIRYVAYGVEDLAEERAFYKDLWGLEEVSEVDGLVYFAAKGSPEHHVARLRQSEQAQIDVIAFAADADADVDALYEKVSTAGCTLIFPPRSLASAGGGGYGFRFFSPDGLPFEISSGVAPRAATTMPPRSGLPEKISHVVMHSPDHKAAVAFFTEVLGFAVSDWLGDFMCFLRCNEWHHRIAILPGPPCLNHVAYDVATVDDMMLGAARLKRAGVDIRWGPGRHTAGDNTFAYFLTPGGNIVEYTSGLERVDEEHWEVTVYEPAPRIMDQWGIGVGGPGNMPKPQADPALFQPVMS